MNLHEAFMRRCIELARKGEGSAAPNPMVGSVIICDGKIIGEGFHEKYGEAHAEVNAIRSVKDHELLKNSTLYVNLEPCSHHGKTPPCADLIIEKGIPEVIIGSADSNSLVCGKGIEKLKKAGVSVLTGILEKECRELNKRFYTFHEKKRPYVILKWAESADGFIDLKRMEGTAEKAVQISGEESQKLVHQWRSEEEAIMVGTTTALLDNPQLTVREVSGKNPIRVTIDKWLRIPKHYYLLDRTTPTIIFTGLESNSDNNLEFVHVDAEKDIVPQVLEVLYKKNIRTLLVEGGEQLLNSFIKNRCWDEARVFIAKKNLLAGVNAPKMTTEPIEEKKVDEDVLRIYRNG